jgi:hypothetical protein
MSIFNSVRNEQRAPDAGARHDHRPYWTRAHHDRPLVAALFLTFTAMGIYVVCAPAQVIY